MSDDPYEPSVAIDLARRKSGRSRVSRWLVHTPRRDSPRVTPTRGALRCFGHDRRARAGMLVLACISLAAVFADLLASDLPIACRWRNVVYVLPSLSHPSALANLDCTRMVEQRLRGDWLVEPMVPYGPHRAASAGDVLLPPMTRHPFGTDAHGRDVFARVMHGTRMALAAGLIASIGVVTIGVILGAVAGFAGGIIDAVIARAVESLTAVPTLVLVVIVSGLTHQTTIAAFVWTIVLTRWTALARLVRAEVLRELGSDHATAAWALGASSQRVLVRHILPSVAGPAIVEATFGVAWVVLAEATVGFLRVGPPGMTGTWGELMGEARSYGHAWWLCAFPGALLFTSLVALSLIGEAARDALDPRARVAPELPGTRTSTSQRNPGLGRSDRQKPPS